MNKIILELLKNPYKYSNNISIEQLVKILEYCAHQYYQLGKPVISDDIYDILLDVLKDREPTNDYLNQVGNKIIKSKEKVNLPYYMGSLDKIKMDSKALDKWNKQFKGPYIISDKIDGVAALYYYDSKSMTSKLYTRGDGQVGQDISFLLQSINIKHNFKKDIYVKGELIIDKKDFIKIKIKNVDIKNARNTVAGIVNSKPSNYNKNIAKFIQFIAYEIMDIELIYDEQLKLLNKIKFKIPYYKLFKKITLDNLNDLLIDRRLKSEYDIDGIVVRDNNIYDLEIGKNPEYAFAYKNILSDQIAEVKIINIEWDISKDKILTPVVIIDKVILNSVEIRRVTAFNAKYVQDNMLNIGSIIKIIRSGDVIPYILEVVKPSNIHVHVGAVGAVGAVGWLEPDVKYKWSKSGVDIIAILDKNSEYNDRYNIKLILHFCITLGMNRLKEGFISKIYYSGYKTIEQFSKIKYDNLIGIDGIGEKMARVFEKEIRLNTINIPINKLMIACNIFGKGIGLQKINLILEKINYTDLIKTNKKKLIEILNNINGINNITSNQFIDNLSKFDIFIKKNKHITIDYNLKNKSGKIFVFSGFRNKELEKYIHDNGGIVANNVTSKTFALIVKDKNSTSEKINKAIKLKIKIILDSELKKLI